MLAYSLLVPFLNVLEEGSPIDCLRGKEHPSCRNLPEHSTIKTPLKKGKHCIHAAL